MKQIPILLCTILLAINASGQTIDKIAGSYIKIDSGSSSFEKDAMLISNNGIVITIEPGNHFFVQPGNLPVVAINGTFTPVMQVDIVAVGAVVAAIMSFPERCRSELDG